MTTTMSTIGDLTLNDVNNTEISIEWKGDTISGVLRDVKTHSWRAKESFMRAGQEVKRGTLITEVTITFSNFVIDKLAIDHPCEVIA